MGWDGIGGLGWGMGLAMGVFWLALIAGIVWLVTRVLPGTGGEPPRRPGIDAAELLDDLLADGKIDLGTWKSGREAALGEKSGRQ